MLPVKKSLLAITTLLLTSGCNYMSKDIDVKPSNEPAYNFSQSSNLLSCVGEMIDNTPQAQPIDIFVSNIPDHTTPSMDQGFLTKNSLMMATTAISRINSDKVSVIGTNGGLKGRRQIQMLGAFTELNRTVQSNALSGDSALPGGIRLSIGNDKQFTHIALDLALAEHNRIVPHTPTSVSIQVKGSTGDIKLSYDEGEDWAASGGIGYKGQEGIHAAQRLLIETSVAIMVSKYYGLEITNCLTKNKKSNGETTKHSYDKPIFQEKKLKTITKKETNKTIKKEAIETKHSPTLDIIKGGELPEYIRELRTQTKAKSYNPSTKFASPLSRNTNSGFTSLNEQNIILTPEKLKKRNKASQQPLKIIYDDFKRPEINYK